MAESQVVPEQVSCEVCLKHIDADATSAETEDYVAYFCGLECYQQWQDKKAESEKPEDTEK